MCQPVIESEGLKDLGTSNCLPCVPSSIEFENCWGRKHGLAKEEIEGSDSLPISDSGNETTAQFRLLSPTALRALARSGTALGEQEVIIIIIIIRQRWNSTTTSTSTAPPMPTFHIRMNCAEWLEKSYLLRLGGSCPLQKFDPHVHTGKTFMALVSSLAFN